jgi:hypothetical protein
MEESVGVGVLEEVLPPPPHAVNIAIAAIAASEGMIRRILCLHFREEQSADQSRAGNPLIADELLFWKCGEDIWKWNYFSQKARNSADYKRNLCEVLHGRPR